MTRFLLTAAICISLAVASTAGAAAQPSPEGYRQAFRKADSGDIAGARALVSGDKLLDKVLIWLELTRWRGGSFEATSAFLTQNPDWPSQNALRLRAEEWLVLNPSHATVLAWFDKNPPTSREGRIRLANAYRATGREADGVGLLRRVWVEDNFDVGVEKNFLAAHGALIEPRDDVARLDRLLWRNQTDAAKRQMMRVNLDQRALADARIHLLTTANGAEAALAKVPPSLQHDPGLIYARLKWNRLKNRDQEARQILLKPPPNPVRPELWWQEREIEARRALADGDNATAYRLAREHHLTDGSDFAEAEWLAGWTALRQRDPKVALTHFRNLFLNARLPVVQARSAYWAGRALDELNKPDEAREFYAKGAAHMTTFYGQLAAGRLGPLAAAQLPPEPAPAEAERKAFNGREVPRVVHRLVSIGETTRIDPFVMRLIEVSEKPEQMALTAQLARDSGRVDLASTVARRAFRDGVVLIDAGYPVLPHVPTAPGAGP
ncbi:MAG: lytic transglycosylase domain-containing protein, partial [Alphaproteobacteria bacterium]|nr:lytic transglycosylase domain-containing protein [Alphaproteobacteria bacterium]